MRGVIIESATRKDGNGDGQCRVEARPCGDVERKWEGLCEWGARTSSTGGGNCCVLEAGVETRCVYRRTGGGIESYRDGRGRSGAMEGCVDRNGSFGACASLCIASAFHRELRVLIGRGWIDAGDDGRWTWQSHGAEVQIRTSAAHRGCEQLTRAGAGGFLPGEDTHVRWCLKR